MSASSPGVARSARVGLVSHNPSGSCITRNRIWAIELRLSRLSPSK